MQWTRAEKAWLAAPRLGVFSDAAKRLARTEAAVRRQRGRIHRRKRRHGELSVAEVARRAGYDRSVVERVSKELGHRWRSNGLTGVRARYWLAADQVEEVLRHVAARPWSPSHAACRQCGTRRVPHKGRGLCRRCHLRGWKKERCRMKK